jgi:hypothetical protein
MRFLKFIGPRSDRTFAGYLFVSYSDLNEGSFCELFGIVQWMVSGKQVGFDV